DAGHQEPDVDIGQRNGEHAVPGPGTVLGVQPVQCHRGALPEAAGTRFREPVDPAAHQVTERVAGEGVQAQQDDVDQHDERAQADEEMDLVDEGTDDVNPEKNDHEQAQEQEIAMVVVQHPGKTRFTAVTSALEFLDGAGRRIPEEGPEIRLSIVVAASPKAQRDDGEDGKKNPDDRNFEQPEAEPRGEEG